MAVDYDVFIVGGGINGCGIARDAAGRGYAVGLCEKADLGSGTSSWSTKLIHGGLRYLEHYEFRLVREALIEREVLWGIAPHIIWPLRFVLPHHKGLRPAWLLRLGLFLYDHLGGRKHLPPTSVVNLETDGVGAPLKPGFKKGFEYSDCWVQDTRLVILNARDAAARGAEIMPRMACIGLKRETVGEEPVWRITLRDENSGETVEKQARLVVNAAGPWVDRVIGAAMGRNDVHNVRLVQGSHIVVRNLFEHDRCYIFQNADGRIIFAIPYEHDLTLIGTTDQDYSGDPDRVAITEAETTYLCSAASEYFKTPVTPDQIVWTYSGVRPLYDDGASKAQEATRDYVLKTDDANGAAPVINIFGGKITTYRKLAESVLDRIGDALGARGQSWTGTAALPGGDFPVDGFEALVTSVREAHPYLSADHVRRLVRNYGTDALVLLDGCTGTADLGTCFGADLTAREVVFLMDREWAQTADDVLWRRSKLGLVLSDDEAAAVQDFMADRRNGGSIPTEDEAA